MWGLGPSHMLVVAIIALLLFGDRLPEVMRSLGQGIVEFKKGMRGIENAIESAATSSINRTSTPRNEIDDREEITAPRFQPPTSAPRLEQAVVESDAKSVATTAAEPASTAVPK
jgi:sec-independent protein translocase protein TatA